MPERQTQDPFEDRLHEGGAEGGDDGAAEAVPGLPSEGSDNSPAGDTDQMSDDPA